MSALTPARLRDLIWELRGHRGCADGSSWPKLQMLLLETHEPAQAAGLLAQVRCELLRDCPNRAELDHPKGVGPRTRALMQLLAPQEPAPRPADQRPKVAANDLAGQGVCIDCGMPFQLNSRGRPRKRCPRCSPPT